MKIAIIGAGVIGVSTAYYLNELGHDVSIFERLSGVGLETSYANAGLLTPSFCDPWNSPGIMWKLLKTLGRESSPIRVRPSVIPSMLTWGVQFIHYSSSHYYFKNFKRNALLASYSSKLMEELNNKINLNFLYKKSGTLNIFRDQHMSLQIKKFKAITDEFNLSSIILDKEETIAKEPALAAIQHELIGSLNYPEDAFGDAFLFTKHMAKYLELNGVHFYYNSTVELVRDKGKRCILKVSHEMQDFDRIVVCAGTTSPRLVHALDMNLPIQPLKGYSLTLDCQQWKNMPQMPIIDDKWHAAITPLGNHLRIGGTAELAGFNKALMPERIEKLKRILLAIYPECYEYLKDDLLLSWTGLRPTSVDGVPFIMSTPCSNLYINSGHGHLGWTLALGSGKLLSDLISGYTPLLSAKEYSFERF